MATSLHDDSNLFCLLPSQRGLKGHPSRYFKVKAINWREVRPSRWGLWILSRLPSLRSVNIFKKMRGEFRTESFLQFPLWLNAHLPNPLAPPPPLNQHCTHLQSPSPYVTQFPVLSIYFPHARCGLPFYHYKSLSIFFTRSGPLRSTVRALKSFNMRHLIIPVEVAEERRNWGQVLSHRSVYNY